MKTTEENNRLIAEFMGAEIDGLNYRVVCYDNVKVCMRPSLLQYHTSWDWLMPVLKKINLKLTPQNYDEWRMISKPTEYTIESVHNQAVQFIEWYNKQKK